MQEASARVDAAANNAAREAQWTQLRARARECEASQSQVDEQVGSGSVDTQ